MHLADDGGNPQGECAGDGHGNQDDDQGVPQCDPENLILEQGLVVAKAHENVRAAHGCVEEAGIDAHKHGVQDKHGKENQERIFERFYRVDKGRSRETGGTGLGLAIVKHIVAVHHADIEVTSEEDKGTEITVTFHKENE